MIAHSHDAQCLSLYLLLILIMTFLIPRGMKKKNKKNIQQEGFAGGHPPNY